MFIDVVHVNGRYSPETGEHITPDNMQDGYYDRLASTLARAASKGVTLLYRPNLNSFTNDIFGDPTELERARDDVALENELLRKSGQAVVLGAYSTECVPAVAHNMSARNPGYSVAIDPALSIDRGAPFPKPEWGSIPHASVDNLIEE